MDAEPRIRPFDTLTDADLLRLLETEEDRLPREAVDEIVRRGDRMIEPLAAICRDERCWKSPEAGSWAPVHATFILGAIGGERALPGLLDALVHAAQHDYASVTDELPDIFARVGPAAVPELRRLLSDTELPATVRAGVTEPIAAIAAGLDAPARDEALDVLRDTASRDPDWAVRGAAGTALLDFARPDDREFLVRLARRLEEKTEVPLFVADDVATAYASGAGSGPRLGDWLHFYDAHAIAARQRERQDELEDERWAQGWSAGADWVQQEIDSITDAFVASLADQDDDARGIARRTAGSMMLYLIEQYDLAPWRWDAPVLEDYLMGHFVRSVMMMDIEVRQVPALVGRFVGFLESTARVGAEDATEMRGFLEREERRFLRRARDPANWGSGKSMMLRMIGDGVDIDDQAAVDAWLARRNAQLKPATIAPKVGRNDPCPCGSKKKYKKCCGK